MSIQSVISGYWQSVPVTYVTHGDVVFEGLRQVDGRPQIKLMLRTCAAWIRRSHVQAVGIAVNVHVQEAVRSRKSELLRGLPFREELRAVSRSALLVGCYQRRLDVNRQRRDRHIRRLRLGRKQIRV